MIPKNISRSAVLKAIEEIEKNGVPRGRESRKYNLTYKNRKYPPKYIVSLANKYVNGAEFDSSEFSGGQETNDFLTNLGFSITSLNNNNSTNLNIHKNDKGERNQTNIIKDFINKLFSKEKRHNTPSTTSNMEKEENPIIETIKTKKKHDQRCSDCKNIIIEMLRRIYGTVKIDHKIDIPTRIEEYKDQPYYEDLRKIFTSIENYRGKEEFVRIKSLHRCDLFIPNPGFVVEFDESQHFTAARKVSLSNYPAELSLGFDNEKWEQLCGSINAKDNDPHDRDEARAWYDTLRDFLPIIKGFNPTIRFYMGDYKWCSLDPEVDIEIFKSKFLMSIQECNKNSSVPNFDKLTVATAVIQSNGKYSNDDRTKLLKKTIDSLGKEVDLILLPAGFYSTRKPAKTLYEYAVNNVVKFLQSYSENITVCLGIDGRDSIDQIALAINKEGIVAIGRKFYPTADEVEYIDKASNYLSLEDGKSRIFEVKGRKLYLAVCYDGLGIRRKSLENPGVDVILDLAHGFNPKGEVNSGEFYFARGAFAGSSKQWNIPTFGSAVFFNRQIPDRWASGVMWSQGDKSIKDWTYQDNTLLPTGKVNVKNKGELAIGRVFKL